VSMASKIISRSESLTLDPTPMCRRKVIAHSSFVINAVASRSISWKILKYDTFSTLVPFNTPPDPPE